MNSRYFVDLMMCHVIRRFIALPVKCIGQGDVLDVFGQIRFYIEINGHLLAFIGFKELFSETETFGFNEIQAGLGWCDIVSCLTGNCIAGWSWNARRLFVETDQ